MAEFNFFLISLQIKFSESELDENKSKAKLFSFSFSGFGIAIWNSGIECRVREIVEQSAKFFHSSAQFSFSGMGGGWKPIHCEAKTAIVMYGSEGICNWYIKLLMPLKFYMSFNGEQMTVTCWKCKMLNPIPHTFDGDALVDMLFDVEKNNGFIITGVYRNSRSKPSPRTHTHIESPLMTMNMLHARGFYCFHICFPSSILELHGQVDSQSFTVMVWEVGRKNRH